MSEKLDVGLLLKAVDVYGATAVVGAENTGVTAASVTLETLAAKVDNVPGAYVFTYDSAWKLDGSPATITEYGVSLTGTWRITGKEAEVLIPTFTIKPKLG